MASRSMDETPLVIRVKNKEELMRLKQLESLVKDLGKKVTIRYLEYLVRGTRKVVQNQVPKNINKAPTPAMSNANNDGPLQDKNKPKIEIPGKFSYSQFLSTKDSNKITFEEFITAAHRWGANIGVATADDLKGYLSHLSLVSAMAATQKYEQQMHIDYDKAIRKQAEEVGWAAFKADNTAVANLYYDSENKEQHCNELESNTEHCSIQDAVVGDEHQSADANICSTLETQSRHQIGSSAIHENLAKSDVKDKKLQSISTVSTGTCMAQGEEKDNNAHLPGHMEGSEHRSMKIMLPTQALLNDGNTGKVDGELSAHSSFVSNQLSSELPDALVIAKRHICSHCSKEFGSGTTLKVHLRRHVKRPVEKRNHLCSFCGKEFKTPSILKQHMRHHTGERPYPCTVCGEKLISAGTLSEHMLRHTGNKQYICSYCGKQFYSSSGLTIHTRIHTGEKPHVCPYCDKRFRGSGYMKSHMVVHTQEKKHKCPKCNRGFNNHGNLKRHMRSHTGEKPYKCPHCSMAYTRQFGLKAHIDLWHRGSEPTRRNPKRPGDDKKPHTCSDCGKQYRYLFTLKMHMITHTGGKALTCPECSKEFGTIGRFRSHMMKHTGEKPHECKECGRGFASITNLEVHAVVHTGEKPHVCSDCGKGFSTSNNLQKHKRIHTGEKPYVCSYCGKAFGEKAPLQLHIMIHTGEKPFVCSECGKGFSRAADLRKHDKVHGEKKKKSTNENPPAKPEGY